MDPPHVRSIQSQMMPWHAGLGSSHAPAFPRSRSSDALEKPSRRSRRGLLPESEGRDIRGQQPKLDLILYEHSRHRPQVVQRRQHLRCACTLSTAPLSHSPLSFFLSSVCSLPFPQSHARVCVIEVFLNKKRNKSKRGIKMSRFEISVLFFQCFFL